MNFKKTVAIAAAAGALAAISVPAMALENEFHGLYRLRGILSNYENATSPGGTTSATSHSMSEFEQRARIQYIAKVSSDLKLVTHFEMDSTWGDNSGGNGGRGIGGAAGADSVNIETKNVYLDFNIPNTTVNAKVGIQGFTDAYKGVFFNDDLGGAFLNTKINGVTTTAGYARLFDGTTWTGAGALNASNNTTGRFVGDLYVLDAKFGASKDLTVGASYYLFNNSLNYHTQDLHTLGLNVAAKAGIVDVDAFVLAQSGKTGATKATEKDQTGYAAQVGAKAAVGAGALNAAVLYATGDSGTNATKNKAFQTTPAGGPGSSSTFYASNMLMLMRSVYAMDTDKAMIMSTNNANQGVMFAGLGYTQPLNDKLAASVNLGYAAVAKRNTTTASSSKNIGTELNAALDYKLFSNLTTSLKGAYVMVGDYNKPSATTDADNLYMTEVMFNFTF